jgi:hypothetical protein
MRKSQVTARVRVQEARSRRVRRIMTRAG